MRPSLSDQIRRQRRRKLAGIAALALSVAALLGGATLISRRVFERPAARPAEPPRPTSDPSSALPRFQPVPQSLPFQVASMDGKVEAFRDGHWTPIKPGDTLTIQDVVRTAPGARAILRRGTSSELELREKVDVRLDRFSGDAATLDVLTGKVVASVSRTGESLEITAHESRAQNEGLARFVVSVDEKKVAVASQSGTTRFSSQGKEVRLAQGTESHADRGKPPAEPEKIPESVLLSVVWPSGERREDRTSIRGQVGPHTSVRVNGVDAEVADDGRFTAMVPLRDGANRIEVEAEELSGLTKKESGQVTKKHTRAPNLQAEPERLWTR